MSATPPPPPPPGAPKKPTALASCILLGILLGLAGAVGGGGWWAYRTFVAGGSSAPPATPSQPPPATTPSQPATAATATPKPSLVERPSTSAAADPLATPVDPAPAEPGPTDPAPAVAVTESPVIPAEDPDPSPTIPDPVVVATPAADASSNPVIPSPEDPTDPLPEPAGALDPDPVVDAEPMETLPPDSPAVAALKEDADRRIDEAPQEVYSDADKQRVRDAIRQAKRLTRVATLRFGTGASVLGANERARLKKALLTPEAETLLSDAQAVIFILGFADATGTPEINRTISQKRAAGVADVLKGFSVPNSSYAVGIGATTILSAETQAKNRAVEVWIVQP